MLTTWILLSGIAWGMLIFKNSQVWNVFTRWLFSADSFRTETIKNHETILSINRWSTLTLLIYGADQKNLRQNLMKAVLVIETASWWTTMVSTRNFFHINFILIAKHSLKHPTLTFNICHSAVEQSRSARLGILSKLCMIWEHSLMSKFSRIKNHWFTSRNVDACLPPWHMRPLFESSSAWAKVSAQDHKILNFFRLV